MPPERRRVACRECQLQKIRCDAEYPESCTRCRRLGLVCAKRVNPNARKTKAQLQRELEQLQSQSSPSRSPSRPVAADSSANGEEEQQGAEPLLFLPPQISPAAANGVADSAISTERPLPLDPTLPTNTPISFGIQTPLPPLPSAIEQCSPRLLDGHEVSRQKIQDCFAIFASQYAPLLPIVDPSLTPDRCFELSQFLFWAIIFVGSRRYLRDPTLFLRLVPRINSIALQALGTRANPIQTIQGLLIICVWPVPLNSMYKDITSVLSGAATHLAMQTGLHVVGSGHDFARTRLDFGYEDILSRAQLWAYCLIISHDTALREGLPPMTVGCSTVLGPEDETLLSDFPQELKLRRKLYNIMVSATTAIMNVLQDHSSPQTPALTPFISLFDAQMTKVIGQCRSPLSLLYAQSYRLHLLSHYFYDKSTENNGAVIPQIHSAACAFLDTIASEDQENSLSQICPVFLERTLSLAAFVVLKISRSPFSIHCSPERSEKAYFSAILFNRRATLQNDDLGARGVTLMSQLWSSKNIFRHGDGAVHSLGTRIRSRLSMSVVFDCFWWWREEFAGQPSPYRDDTQSVGTPESGQRTHDGSHWLGQGQGQGQAHEQEDSRAAAKHGGFNGMAIVPDGPFPDFDWAANFDFSDVNWSPSAFPIPMS